MIKIILMMLKRHAKLFIYVIKQLILYVKTYKGLYLENLIRFIKTYMILMPFIIYLIIVFSILTIYVLTH